ncbi:MAG: ACT domain-containing protein [Actinomycetes bacterium]
MSLVEPVPEPDRTPAVHALIRVWLPDRPGALGLVASRIGAMRGDIVGIDVLETGDGVAVDEFAVALPDAATIPLLVREIEQVDGVSVEEVRRVGAFPDPRVDALDSAVMICEAGSIDDLWRRLATHTRGEFLADWTAVLVDGRLALGDGPTPPVQTLAAYAAGASESPAVLRGDAGPADLAVAALPDTDVVLLVGRDGHAFRQRERLQLLRLVRIAARMLALLTPAG